MATTDAPPDGVQRYIEAKKNVLRNMGRLQNLMVALQTPMPLQAEDREILRKMQTILDDPFAADGLPTST